jgi:hypothetical protein
MTNLTDMKRLLDSIPEEHKAVQRAREEVDKAKAEFARALAELQEVCEHPLILEHDYIPSDFVSAVPPRRKCQLCGLAEDGWGSGYKNLENRWCAFLLQGTRFSRETVEQRHVVRVSRDKLYQFSVGDEPIL